MSRNSTMPEVGIPATLTGRNREIAEATLHRGRLRRNKPIGDGEAAWVWRMLAFYVSPISKHQCMPMTADFDLPAQYWSTSPVTKLQEFEGDQDKLRAWLESPERTSELIDAADRRRARTHELQAIVDELCSTVPKSRWHGVKRWARALG